MAKSKMKQLKETVILGSESYEWEVARNEWEVVCQYSSEAINHCACGHAIKNIVQIYNPSTDVHLKVGTTCINKFNTYALSGITAKSNATNPEHIKEAYSSGKINDWEYNFLENIWTRKILSLKQKRIKLNIFKKIFRNIGVR